MDESIYDSWNTISSSQLSNDGNWVVYEVNPGKGDGKLFIYDASNQRNISFERGTNAQISADNEFVVFKQTPHYDSIQLLRRQKIKKDELPPDTLVIYNLKNRKVDQIPYLKSFQLPEKWGGFLAYQLDNALMVSPTDTITQVDSMQVNETIKKESEENGSLLIFRNLKNKKEDSVQYVTQYLHAPEKAKWVVESTGDDKQFLKGIYTYDPTNSQLKALYRGDAKFSNHSISQRGKYVSFMVDRDTTEVETRPMDLFLWSEKQDSARLVFDNSNSILPNDWIVSKNASLQFSKNEERLFFGIAPTPLLQDSTILDDEIVNVEVWTYQDKKLYTQQNVELEKDKNQSYPVVLDLKKMQFHQLGIEAIQNYNYDRHREQPYGLGINYLDYNETLSWEGYPPYVDVYTINLNNGKRKKIATKVKARPNLSPETKYIYWYSRPDIAFFAHHIKSGKTNMIVDNKTVHFCNELEDRPTHPSSYGSMGWMEDDEFYFLYDRYDIWKIDPKGKKKPERLTKGRENKTRYRYIRLDQEATYLKKNQDVFVHIFNEVTKDEGYGKLSLSTLKLDVLSTGNFAYQRFPTKAKNADKLLYTKQNFQTYPNLQLSNLSIKDSKIVSDANPQQKDYNWGTIELFKWTATDGQELEGLLVKPEDFDPAKKYPLLVNFYERSSNRLHRHRHPFPHRSTINYTFYANRGYVIFNPDVPYQIGYPGKSAENSVLSGIEALAQKGFIDREKIGVQGHSWGGYQVAHLVTKTDIFACAESGAPVVNMISAYGGIRWRSGLSRMFQYERTQSRIGGTLWEKPELYIENSPIFNIDKVTTPVLIMHNDKDGAVPWYQGIEFFVAMRRLGKKAWMLNYNKEPHWPVKRQNRIDFNIRMQQFFDHYLKDAPMPKWMKNGVPATEKGILQGLD